MIQPLDLATERDQRIAYLLDYYRVKATSIDYVRSRLLEFPQAEYHAVLKSLRDCEEKRFH